MPIALITGATSGIGKEVALKFAEYRYDVIITGRRKERLEYMERLIRDTFESKVFSLCFDVSSQEEVFRNLNGLPHEWKNIDVLVNNAGLASGLGPLQSGDTDDWNRMIDTNIKGLLYVTRMISPWMISRRKGHIINIGSIAGKESYPGGNVYSATKAAVSSLSRSMRIDMLNEGIKVTAILPGLAETEFSQVRFKGDNERAAKVYDGLTPLSAKDIAEVVWFAANRPPHVVLNEIELSPLAQASAAYIHRQTP